MPSKSTLVGAWSVGITSADSFFAITEPISFGLKYPGVTPPKVLFVEEEGDEENCAGTLEAPAAKPGFLCVYLDEINSFGDLKHVPTLTEPRVKTTGAVLFFEPKFGEEGPELGMSLGPGQSRHRSKR